MTKHKSQDERREQILEAAMECFVQNGYAHTRVDDIAKQAGLSKGGIYFHFGSKKEIFDAVQEVEIERTMQAVMDANQSEESALGKIQALARQLLINFSQNEEHQKFLIVLAEMGIRNPEVRERIVSSHETYVQVMTAQIQVGVEEGEIRNVPPAAAAMVLKLLMDGVEQAFALGYNIDIDSLVSDGLDILVNGLRPRD